MATNLPFSNESKRPRLSVPTEWQQNGSGSMPLPPNTSSTFSALASLLSPQISTPGNLTESPAWIKAPPGLLGAENDTLHQHLNALELSNAAIYKLLQQVSISLGDRIRIEGSTSPYWLYENEQIVVEQLITEYTNLVKDTLRRCAKACLKQYGTSISTDVESPLYFSQATRFKRALVASAPYDERTPSALSPNIKRVARLINFLNQEAYLAFYSIAMKLFLRRIPGDNTPTGLQSSSQNGQYGSGTHPADPKSYQNGLFALDSGLATPSSMAAPIEQP